jgi:hypothetical protein
MSPARDTVSEVTAPLAHSVTARDRIGRAVVVVCIALGAAVVAGGMAVKPATRQDFAFYYRAAQLWAAGVDPYTVPLRSALWPLPDPLFYPFPAVLVTWPVHWLPQPVAVALFVGVPAGMLAWRLSRDALWPLLLLASPSFVMAAILGQWSPWLVLGMLAPWAAWSFVCKPSLGLACLLARPSRDAIAACVVLGALSLFVFPTWPVGWLHALQRLDDGHGPPILRPGGVVLALALLRWRRADARLLLAFACVPQLLFFADQLPLLLIARERREAAFLLAAGWLAALLWYVRDAGHEAAVWFAEPYVALGVYLPALYLVLRRPNEAPAARGNAGSAWRPIESTARTRRAGSYT